VDEFVSAVQYVVDLVHTSNTFWNDALGMARRVLNI